MKRLAPLFLWFLGLGLAQVGPLLPQVAPAPTRPGWIRPGLVVTFDDGYGTTAVVYLVTRVGERSAYGFSFSIRQSEAGPQLKVQAGALYQGGSGPIYLAPEALERMVRRPPPGLQVQAAPGAIGWTVEDADGVSRYAVRYDPATGKVLEMNGSYRGPAGVGPRRNAAFHLAQRGLSALPWAPVPGFPPAARAGARYQIVYALASGTAPGGYAVVEPIALGTPLARYRVRASGTGGPEPPQEKDGLPALGPHYLHPALLRRNPVFAFPSVGLALQNAGPGPNGGVLLVWTYRGSAIESLEVDPQTGAVIEQRVGYAGIGTAIYRRLP